MGHAVVIDDTAMLKHWHLPEEEQFASAICVPIASPSAPLGTLWMFSREPRGFDAVASNMVEITAGRVAAELDRWMLLNEGMRSKRMERELTDAVSWQLSRLPPIAPAIEGWQVAGWTSPAVGLNREFHDWAVVPDGTLSLTVGAAHGALVEAGLTAAMLHTAVKDHGCYRHRPVEMVDRVMAEKGPYAIGFAGFNNQFCFHRKGKFGGGVIITNNCLSVIITNDHHRSSVKVS